MDRFPLRMWLGNGVTDEKPDLSTATNSILAREDELAVRAAELENQFNPIAEFDILFPQDILRELQPLQKINYEINVMSG